MPNKMSTTGVSAKAHQYRRKNPRCDRFPAGPRLPERPPFPDVPRVLVALDDRRPPALFCAWRGV